MVHESRIKFFHKSDLWPLFPFAKKTTTKIVEDISTTHEFLEDFKPLSDVFTVSNLVKQVMKGALIPLNLFMMEFNRYLDRLDRYQSEGSTGLEPQFDYDAAIARFTKKFYPDAIRFYLTSIIRKLLEEYCLYHYSPGIADLLTKDLQRSLLRKYRRNPHSRMLVSQQIFITSLQCNFLTYTALWLYDIGKMFYDARKKFYGEWKRRKHEKTIIKVVQFAQQILIEIMKKTGFHVLSSVSSSFGYAVGSYVNLKYGSVVGGLLCEAIAMNAFTLIVGSDDNNNL